MYPFIMIMMSSRSMTYDIYEYDKFVLEKVVFSQVKSIIFRCLLSSNIVPLNTKYNYTPFYRYIMTTIKEIIDDGDLTTDAMPQPPREEKVIVEEPENDEKEPIIHAPTTSPRAYSKYPKKNKQKTKSSTPIANIINIQNCNGVQIGKTVTYNIHKSPSRHEEKEKDKCFVKTDLIIKTMNSNEAVTREHLLFVSAHVGEGWRDIGRLLDYSEGQTYQFEETHSIKGVKEVVYQLLLDWIQNKPEQATIGKLTTVLWDSRQEEVVQMLSKKLLL